MDEAHRQWAQALSTIGIPWQQMAWLIEDEEVLNALRRHGYWYEQSGESSWYRTNLPIAWHGTYEFDDGEAIESQGTYLRITHPPQRERAQPKEDHPMQEIWDRVEAMQG